jgi:DNA-binding beta-propeller fold protein YncE
MKKIEGISILLLYLLIYNNIQSQDAQIFQSDKLTRKWETPQTLKVPESVCYDPEGNIFYVSNVNGKPTEKDGNGFISKINPDGTMNMLNWATGLSAPKGMGIYKSKLYVTDIDRVAEIDMATGKIVNLYKFPYAKFLNDIAIDNRGAVYISDMMSTRIYRIYEGKSETWLDDTTLTNPNGLFAESGHLVIGCNKIVKVGYTSKSITVWLGGTGSIDGLEAVGDGRYLFSDWNGNIYLAGTDKKVDKILDTTPAGINAADIEYIPSKKLLLVPTFNDNRIMAYELK